MRRELLFADSMGVRIVSGAGEQNFVITQRAHIHTRIYELSACLC